MLADRRNFLKSLGLIGASSLACNRAPLQKLYAYLTPPEDIIPGIAYYYASVCRACPAGCGILVKTREARPIKLEGNPAHPVNSGALCPRGQAFIQSLYGRHRVQKPLMRINGGLTEVSWTKAVEAAASRLSASKKTVILTGLESGSFEDLLYDFKAKFPGTVCVMHEPGALDSLAAASELIFGRREVPKIDISGADYIVSLGADFLDAWVSPVEYTKAWAENHGINNNNRLMFMEYFGPRRNLTANAADRWHRTGADSIFSIASAILSSVFEIKKMSLDSENARLVERIVAALRKHETVRMPENGEVKRIASRLCAASNGTVLYGGTEVTGGYATLTHAAVLLTNFLTGSLNRRFIYSRNYALSKIAPEREIAELIGGLPPKTGLMIVYGTNPVYTMPIFAKTAGESNFIICISHEYNETTDIADLVLPAHHPLESWGDYEVTEEIRGLMQPVRSPLYDSKHAGDLLIEIARKAGKPLLYDSFKKYVTSHWATFTGNDDKIWERILQEGGAFYKGRSETIVSPVTLNSSFNLPDITAEYASNTDTLTLAVSFSSLLLDGRGVSNNWLMEVPDSISQTAWEIPVEIPVEIAESQGIRDGDIVSVKSPAGEIRCAAIVSNDLHEKTIALKAGGGRIFSNNGYESGNAFALIGESYDGISGSPVLARGGITITKIGAGRIASVSGGSGSEERFLALAMTLGDLKSGRFPRMTRHGEEYPDSGGRFKGAPVPMPHEEIEGTRPGDNVNTLYEYPEHRWGMVIDLDKCTGCGACVVACYAENNIPVVGREEVLRGRELAWIRIEKHVTGSGSRAFVNFLPVMCQQCGQAPCESVCPVFASYHTKDGLNAQVYNRCIGTRYCANNCPYKVRRFNWFDYKREAPSNEQLNPDVTVRTRGVMEKCTFCIQRIREARIRAKAEKRAINDGEIIPACAQTCPAGAIIFGDFKQRDHRMAVAAKDPRGYRLLDYYVNTRPSVVYLRRVITGKEDLK